MPRNYLRSGSWNAICDVCGLKFKSEQLRERWDGLMVCREDFELRHMQDFVQTPIERIAPPWVRPEAEPDLFLPECTPNGQSAVPGEMEPGCIIPNFISPAHNPSGDFPPASYGPPPSFPPLVPPPPPVPPLNPNYLWQNGSQEWRRIGFSSSENLGMPSQTALLAGSKTYCEFSVTDWPDDTYWSLGLINYDPTLPCYDWFDTSVAVASAYSINNPTAISNPYGYGVAGPAWGSNSFLIDAGYQFLPGERVGLAFDHISNKLWVSRNGVWVTGNPSTGTPPADGLGTNQPTLFWFTSVYQQTGTTHPTVVSAVSIYPRVSDFLYPIPTGFSPYQPS